MKNLLINRSLPIIVGITILILVVIQWRTMIREEDAQIGRMTKLAVSSLNKELAYEMDARINALIRMAKRWESRGKLNKNEWEADGELYLDHYPGYQAIEVVDNSYNGKWIVPPIKEGHVKRRHDLFIAATEQRKIMASHTVSLVDGNKGFEVYVPVFRNNDLLGFIVGVFRCRELFDSIVLHNSNYSGYGISFFDGANEIYTLNRANDLQLRQWAKDEFLSFHGVSWQISMSPLPAFMSSTRTSSSIIVLTGGASLSLLLSLALYFAQTAWLRQKAALAANILLGVEIADRKRLEKERSVVLEILGESENRYRMLVDSMGEGFGIHDENGIITYFNDSFCKMIGYTIEELIGRPTTELLDAENRRILNYQMLKRREGEIIRYEMAFTKKDGQKLYAIIAPRPIFDNKGKFKGSFAVITDISERKRLEGQLIQSQKMEAVGQLAAGIAHDFNNILSTINGYAEFMLSKMKDDDRFRIPMEEIFASGERAAGLVKRLMAFSRKQSFNPSPQNLNEIIREMEKTLLMLIREDIEFKTSIADEELIVTADAIQIEQLLINLAINARDAMPDGGTLSISLEKTASPTAGDDGSRGYALITMADTGVGMDKETRERVFEPFFTTKDIGEGTGLGLSIVYEIVKQNNGLIELSSQPGAGATFRIYLPLTGAESGTAHSEEPDLDSHGTEKILLAEDGALVRKYTGSILRDSGYTVLEAVDGDDAIAKFSEHRDSVALLVLDVIMPKKNGREAFEEIKKIRPDIKVIFMSAYTNDIVDKKGLSGEAGNFIAKPVSPKDMLRKVREALDNE